MTKMNYLLSFNRYSRIGKKTNKPKCIVLHHAENEGYGAIEQRNYFENLKLGKNAIYYSTHYIVGFEGEVIYCIPEEEISYHRGNGADSKDAISITCCSRNNAFPPGRNALNSLKLLVREISKRYDFNINDDFLLHYEVAGLRCPLYYVENSDKWILLKEEILRDTLEAKDIAEKSDMIASIVSSMTGVEEMYLKEIFEEKAAPDISTISRVVKELIKK